ncbi:hypothetical protein BKA83DRAFT_4479929 [Pisolithus microcarpus]|nr:hypothetical protein BKA83DRAFT_4479929 [Pisolithus microcarpus]
MEGGRCIDVPMGGRYEVEETKEKRELLGRPGRTLWLSWALISKRATTCASDAAFVHIEGTPSITLRKAATLVPAECGTHDGHGFAPAGKRWISGRNFETFIFHAVLLSMVALVPGTNSTINEQQDVFRKCRSVCTSIEDVPSQVSPSDKDAPDNIHAWVDTSDNSFGCQLYPPLLLPLDWPFPRGDSESILGSILALELPLLAVPSLVLVRQGARVRTLPATNATRPNSDDPLSKKGGEQKGAGLDMPVLPREESRRLPAHSPDQTCK